MAESVDILHYGQITDNAAIWTSEISTIVVACYRRAPITKRVECGELLIVVRFPRGLDHNDGLLDILPLQLSEAHQVVYSIYVSRSVSRSARDGGMPC